MLAVIYFGCGNAFGLWKSQNPVEKSLVCGKLFDLWKTFGSLKNVAKKHDISRARGVENF
jgi:hypothetical protein